MALILLAEKDHKLGSALKQELARAGHETTTALTQEETLKFLSVRSYEIIILDMDIMRESDFDLINFIKQSQPMSEILLTTRIEEIEKAVRSLRRGAYMYFVKPFDSSDLLFGIESALKNLERSMAFREYERSAFIDMMGDSPAIRKMINLATKVAPTDSTVLLLGESGTGKEIIAEYIHRMSNRYDKPFLAINCSALPETLLESELFGYVKGAFTGAAGDRKGLFEEGNNGTIFLDEVGDMPLITQVKLLRVLENREVRRLGENKIIKVNVRIIAATNQDLLVAMQEKRFRDDLFFRLNVIQIKIPPLRERMDSLPSLIRYFIAKFNRRFNRKIREIDRQALFILANYQYPGNVRELENIIEHAVIMADDDVIRANSLPEYLQVIKKPMLALPSGMEEAVAAAASEAQPAEPEFITLSEMEKRLITDTLIKCGGNQTVAAEKLGISRSTLWRKMKEYNIRTSFAPEEVSVQ
ncbi:MAG: sigma-54-dependent Fis family transcriptional regulator [Candidatus Abyssobacteria bacterium SURF_5]|uniref:Sigma-54-dependent Fis family transcriptional regulator n=1 Tax=Abyssobacteria bacterium (strain SURF_5) TaxID=2093360 RepID=A0A3A4NFU4_ABYX5|nr:MAG: sigma-54-dependent Fis family transcriptional regulator [Candidatus Abyssubacteria bacterium SURF_5]